MSNEINREGWYTKCCFCSETINEREEKYIEYSIDFPFGLISLYMHPECEALRLHKEVRNG